MKLEQIFESYYVGPAAYVRNSTSTELLDIIESVHSEYPAIAATLKALHANKVVVNESTLDEDSKVVLAAFQKLLEYYNTQNDRDFNTRLQYIFEDPLGSDPTGAVPPAPPTPPAPKRKAPPPKKGILNKVGSFLGKAATGLAKGIGALAGSVVAGFKGAAGAGAQGKTDAGQTKPGWVDVNTTVDLKSVPTNDTTAMPQQLQSYKIDQNTLDGLKQGTIKGINLQNAKTNQLAQIVYNAQTGLFSVKQIALPAAQPQQNQPPAPAPPSSSPDH